MLTEGRVDRKVKDNKDRKKDRKKDTNMEVGYFMANSEHTVRYKPKLSEQPEV